MVVKRAEREVYKCVLMRREGVGGGKEGEEKQKRGEINKLCRRKTQ
jgi:hypothetical protein